jgi:1,4-alpha-glucan branching enzyme
MKIHNSQFYPLYNHEWIDSPLKSPARPLRSIKSGHLFNNFEYKYNKYKEKNLNWFFIFVIKITVYVLKKLRLNCEFLNRVLVEQEYNFKMTKICKKIISEIDLKKLQISTSPSFINLESIFSEKVVDVNSAYLIYKSFKYKNDRLQLSKLQGFLENNQEAHFRSFFSKCSKRVQFILCNAFSEAHGILDSKIGPQELIKNPQLLLEISDDYKKSVFTQFIEISFELEEGYRDLATLSHAEHLAVLKSSKYSSVIERLSPKILNSLSFENSQSIHQQLDSLKIVKEELLISLSNLNDKIRKINHAPLESQSVIYGTSINDLETRNNLDGLDLPLTIAMVGIEYASLIRQGGLAEAIEGLTRSISTTHPNSKARLFFPKYNKIPSHILNQMEKVQENYYDDYGNEINLFRASLDNVECFFIEDESFDLDNENPNIYGPNEEVLKKRFITFSKLAANVLYHMPGNDIIHLHDWHVAGVGLKLVKDHKQEWEEGLVPPIVFTFHNNNRGAQGRIHASAYNYDPVVKALHESGIAQNNENMFVEILKIADAVTTVSETFSVEAQLPEFGEGISFAVQNAAKIGKLVGVINGVNTTRWNAEIDPTLCQWKDIDTGEPLDLSFGPDHENAYAQKKIAKVQLNKWIKKYLPKPQSNFTLDPDKPLLTYIGRLDSYQKGLDKLEDAINSALKNGAQFIVLGSQEDPEAAILLDNLKAKFNDQILIIRDYKDENGNFHYQDGNDHFPGIGKVIRAATDFQYVPSRFEPCGLVQFESWLFGAQVIASNVGGLADTIITRNANPNQYNGYLFDRDSNSKAGAYHQVSQAIKDWKLTNPQNKDLIIKRLINDGRKYSWSSSPFGLTPVQKYRRVYQLAMQRVCTREQSKLPLRFDIQDHFHKRVLSSNVAIKKSSEKEEAYLSAYYQDKNNDKTLEKMYRALPESLRKELPGPYSSRIKFETYNELGAFANENGVNFIVDAPKAKKVNLKLFNQDRELIKEVPLSKSQNGYWQALVEDSQIGQLYQYEVNEQIKIDPYGLLHVECEDISNAPYSVVCDRNSFDWTDQNWIDLRIKKAGLPQPMNIYEMHPTAWKQNNKKILNFRELADELIPYLKNSHYTHVELMGILEHAYEGSMGYQVIGYFSPNSRLGNLDDFKYLINSLHENEIGVILDWIPAHFSKNSYALPKFDGTNQFEPSFWDLLFSKRRFYRWGTSFFDYTKKSVREFLISNAVYWLNEMHIDGLRVDAVSCILDSENQDYAKLFLRELNAIVHTRCNGSITIAEDYSGNQDVSRPTYKEGLGFDMKWNITWMHYTLKYFSTNPYYRTGSYENLVNAIEKDKAHKMVLALSHDEVTKNSETLLNKIKGINSEARYANVRLLMSFMMSSPGKKLNFMGNESGAKVPWTDYLGRNQGLMDTHFNREEQAHQLQRMCIALNELYLGFPTFWEKDDNGSDVEWIENNDIKGKLLAYRRQDTNGESLAFVHNVAGNTTLEYTVPVSESVDPKEIFNSDKKEFGGKDRLNPFIELVFHKDKITGYKIKVPPLSTIIIQE